MISKNSYLLILTFNCNNNCVFCSTAANKKYFLTLEGIKKEVSQAKKQGKEIIVLFGGEPTVHPKFFDVLDFLCKEEFNVILESNLRLFSYKNLARKILNFGNILNIQTSLHGHNAELHDSLTRTKGSFDQTIRAIKNFFELGFQRSELSVNTVIVKQNLPYLEEIVKFEIQELEIKRIKFSFLEIVGNATHDLRHILPTFSEIKPKLKEVVDLSEFYRDVLFSIEKGPLCVCPNEKVNYIYELELITSERFFHPKKCYECQKIKKCMGIQKRYFELYGSDELTPFL